MVRPNNDLFCAVCKKDTVKLSRCTGCKAVVYCSKECQTSDWARHKAECKKGEKWYDKHRLCRDNTKHHGKLELITWDSKKEGTGWGHCFAEESDDLKKKFETEFEGNHAKFYKYWPQGFRWTCCGMSGDSAYGCDHHGALKRDGKTFANPSPCTCDFCRMGKPLPDRIYNDGSAERMGLQLSRGPDPRSRNFAVGAIANMARGFLGMDSSDEE